jgi:hypothetical protein
MIGQKDVTPFATINSVLKRFNGEYGKRQNESSTVPITISLSEILPESEEKPSKVRHLPATNSAQFFRLRRP